MIQRGLLNFLLPLKIKSIEEDEICYKSRIFNVKRIITKKISNSRYLDSRNVRVIFLYNIGCILEELFNSKAV